MKLNDFLQAIEMGEKEIDIYLSVLTYGKTTASVVAQALGRERTSTYKMMNHMVAAWRLSSTHERRTTFFLPVWIDLLRQRLESQRASLNTIADSYHDILHEYKSIQSTHQFHTSVKLLSGESSIRYAYQTMRDIIEREHLRFITCIASHTLEVMSGSDPVLQEMYDIFFTSLQHKKVTVSSHLGLGMSLMEKLQHSLTLETITQMPHANNATHVRIVGYDIFLLMFTTDPQIIHIHSPQVAGLLMFIAEQLEER